MAVLAAGLVVLATVAIFTFQRGWVRGWTPRACSMWGGGQQAVLPPSRPPIDLSGPTHPSSPSPQTHNTSPLKRKPPQGPVALDPEKYIPFKVRRLS